ncbi:septin CDC11 KNAG_0G00160 [Huiozyma naganishii CBS 8797]|uniref:Septin-type G domain-containing protein n=1 Tax=Huiozyma naganishii (strain ATCC MYA-139 / BCRC 22969 / CBS 8797 / KCTC 17520 / NBRC 10181 / NCYC 3082 / Yp74L-3) TaxID=1071383 RepID=J7R890_HUIN7|nr:hypothetical protein KNAG_0G00160 [Kazachstania naganishii CBS 8797]CCK71075.1 hypothetical protein KNAG_0G00160 [Kazachstania naganishii CBS 8797]
MSGIIEASSALRKRKHLKRGINFTVMVVGQSGTGRSTFINTLCGQQVVDVSTTVLLPTDTATEVELQLREETVELEDDEGVKIQLNIIDTPGFGDSLDNTAAFEVVSDYVRHQYDEILLEESRVRRNPRFKDGRVHCCLYLVQATGHGLKEIDVEFMRQLGPLVNVIPLVCKADSLTPEELKLNKRLIMEDVARYGLPIYDFPFDEADVTQEDYDTYTYLRSILPFSIIGSNDVFTQAADAAAAGGPAAGEPQQIRGRKYPWGTLDVEDTTISDFVVLRNALLISHLHDLKDHTHEILYERYRTEALSGEGPTSGPHGPAVTSPTATGATGRSYSRVAGATTTPSAASTPRGEPGESSAGAPTLGSPAGEPSAPGAPGDPYTARDEQIRLEEERLRAFEERVQQELQLKRQELLARERELRDIEARLEREAAAAGED